MRFKPAHALDFYKTGHPAQYAAGTEIIYSNFTPRSARLAVEANKVLDDFDHKVVNVGIQGICRWLLQNAWNEGFFWRPREKVVADYQERCDKALGPGAVDAEKYIGALHDLGFLPVSIKALPEGSRVNTNVPVWTIRNTHPDFFWVTNMLETMLSAEQWRTITNATIAFEYRRLMERYAVATGAPLDFVDWQGHDFSMRGMGGVHDAAQSGIGHLAPFKGTDTASAIDYIEDFYQGKSTFIGGSVPASEHAVTCLNIFLAARQLEQTGEYNGYTVERLGGGTDWMSLAERAWFLRALTEVYPTGIASLVSDTFDFFRVICEDAAFLKPEIMAREGKSVFRPDSGSPVHIVCGAAYPLLPDEDAGHAAMEGYAYYVRDGKYYQVNRSESVLNSGSFYYGEEVEATPQLKGAVECLWDIFGGTETEKGYRVLDSHVGLIYGDSITLDRADAIMDLLQRKGFASCNCVFGIGLTKAPLCRKGALKTP